MSSRRDHLHLLKQLTQSPPAIAAELDRRRFVRNLAFGAALFHNTPDDVTAQDAIAMLEPGDLLVDCTGSTRCYEITWRRAPATRPWLKARTR